ncbi:unnamed protein product [Musa textilis]
MNGFLTLKLSKLGNSVTPAGGMEMRGMAASGSLGAERERFAAAADPALRQLNRRRRATTSIARTVPSAQSHRSTVRSRPSLLSSDISRVNRSGESSRCGGV